MRCPALTRTRDERSCTSDLATRLPELFNQGRPQIMEGAGKTGRRLAPMVRVQQKSTRQNHRFSRNHPAFPAQWFYGLYVISPVRPGFVVTVVGVMRSIIASEAPASGRQDHTLSPSASCCSSDDTTRPSHPAPNVRDDRRPTPTGSRPCCVCWEWRSAIRADGTGWPGLRGSATGRASRYRHIFWPRSSASTRG